MANPDYDQTPMRIPPTFLERRRENPIRRDEVESQQSGTPPTMLQEMIRRAKIRVAGRDGEDLSPFDVVRRDYRTLQDDNLVLIEDLRHAILAEESMRYKLEEVERERDALKIANINISRTMGSMTRALRTGGDAFNEAMKEAANWLEKHPEGPEAYKPKPSIGKIPTGAEATAAILGDDHE